MSNLTGGYVSHLSHVWAVTPIPALGIGGPPPKSPTLSQQVEQAKPSDVIITLPGGLEIRGGLGANSEFDVFCNSKFHYLLGKFAELVQK